MATIDLFKATTRVAYYIVRRLINQYLILYSS